VQLIKFTLRRGPTGQTEMSLTTAGIHCSISQRLSGAMEDCSIVRVQQPRTLCRRRCWMSASRRMFGSLWNAAAAHDHRRQDGSRRPCTMAKRQTTTGGRTWPPWSGCAGALVASVADGGRLKMREWKMRYGQKCKGGKCRSIAVWKA